MSATKKKVVRNGDNIPKIRPRRPIAATAQLLTIPQAADYTGFAAMTLRHWMRQRRPEYVKIAGDRTMMELAGHVSKRMLARYSHISNTAKRNAIAAAFDTESEALKASDQKQAAPEGGTHYRTHSENGGAGQVM